MNLKYKDYNAIKEFYRKKYELDKHWGFRWPRLKNDVEAYLNYLLQITDELVDNSSVPRVKGHNKLKPPKTKHDPTKNEIDSVEDMIEEENE